MKKFLALLLAAMMLLSCTTAMAAERQHDYIVNELHKDWDSKTSNEAWKQNTGDDNATFGAFDSVRYGDDLLNQTKDDNYDKSGELGTELWMQVTADGQIDVTVPLVLVFQTNIDGGYATTADKYQILNNNNAEIVVTKMEFNKTGLGNGDLMTMKRNGSDLLENEYYATLTATDLNVAQNTVYYNGEKVEPIMASPLDEKSVDRMKVFTTKENYDKNTPNDDSSNYQARRNNSTTYDMSYYAYTKPAKTAGLFKLNKTENGGFTPTPTVIDVAMKTGRLTFVTQDEDETELMNKAKGIHLLTTTYTVAIDTSNLYEYTIRGANDSPLTSAGKTKQTEQAVYSNTSYTVNNMNPADQNDHNEIDDRSLNNADGKTTGNDTPAGDGQTDDNNQTDSNVNDTTEPTT